MSDRDFGAWYYGRSAAERAGVGAAHAQPIAPVRSQPKNYAATAEAALAYAQQQASGGKWGAALESLAVAVGNLNSAEQQLSFQSQGAAIVKFAASIDAIFNAGAGSWTQANYNQALSSAQGALAAYTFDAALPQNGGQGTRPAPIRLEGVPAGAGAAHAQPIPPSALGTPAQQLANAIAGCSNWQSISDWVTTGYALVLHVLVPVSQLPPQLLTGDWYTILANNPDLANGSVGVGLYKNASGSMVAQGKIGQHTQIFLKACFTSAGAPSPSGGAPSPHGPVVRAWR